MDGIQIRVSDLVYQIKKRWTLILALTIAGLVAGLIISGASYLQGAMTKSYEIKASAAFSAQTSGGRFTSDKKYPDLNDFRLSVEMAETARFMTKSERLLTEAIDGAGLLGITPKDVSSNLKVSVQPDTPVLEFTLTWRTAEEGVKLLSEVLSKAEKTFRDTVKTGTLAVIDEPTAKYIVGGSVNAPIWGVMMLIGFAAGIGIAVLEILLSPTVINIADIQPEIGIETIGVIPSCDRYFENMGNILSHDGTNPDGVRQDYSAAAYILKNRLGKSDKCRTVFVTSAIRGEGRTATTAHLAVLLADMGSKVLMIDFDVRNPELSSIFLKNTDYAHSMNALYRGDINEKEAVTQLTGCLDILPAVLERTPVPVDSVMFDLVGRLSENYDFVIIDTAPVGEIADTLSLNQISDAAVLVIGYDSATKPQIKDAVEKMEKSGIRIVGCVVNKEKSVETSGFFSKEPAKSKKKTKKSGRGDFEDELTKPDDGKKNPKKKGLFRKKKKEEFETDESDRTETGGPSLENPENARKEAKSASIPQKVLSDEEAMNALIRLGSEK